MKKISVLFKILSGVFFLLGIILAVFRTFLLEYAMESFGQLPDLNIFFLVGSIAWILSAIAVAHFIGDWIEYVWKQLVITRLAKTQNKV